MNREGRRDHRRAGGSSAFLYADLLALPLLDEDRRYFGWQMAAFMAALFSVTMAVSALATNLAFASLGLVPPRDADIRARLTDFALNSTFRLNLVFGTLAVYLFRIARRNPMHLQVAGQEPAMAACRSRLRACHAAADTRLLGRADRYGSSDRWSASLSA